MSNIVVGLFCACLGSPFLLVGLLFLLNTVRLARIGIRVTGRVVGECHGSSEEHEMLYRIVEFTDESGIMHRHQLLVASSDDPPVGQRIDLVYDPDDPKCVSGRSFSSLWAFPVLSSVAGAVLVVCGVLIVSGVIPVQ
jgi:hypothetical protein